jgi:carbamoyl-phosphate synthase small subunit
LDRVVLVLSDGKIYYGTPFGAEAPVLDELVQASEALSRRLRDVGEVVFNTAMSGYGEVLTDPSYTGQIVVMTYPHAGNYGIDEAWSEVGPETGRYDESPGEPRPHRQGGMTPRTVHPRRIKPAGMIVRSLYRGPVPDGRIPLAAYLSANDVPGATDIDTRALTLDLRDNGSRNGLLCRPADGVALSEEETQRALDLLRAFPPMEGRGLIGEVGSSRAVRLPGGKGPHIALYDCGTKANIIRELQNLGCSLTLMPSTATADEIRATGADAVMLSNGPGDPAVLQHQVDQTRELLGTIPVLGICLGHQIIAEAAGAKTYKMKFGHHGINHPVREEIVPGGRVFVTSQNHGFSVDENTIPEGMRVWFRNANDGTVEGLFDDRLRVRSTQFHPESAPGPTDSRWIFSAFLEVI